MNPIALLHSKYETLTHAEQKLADYIIQNPRCVLDGRMSQLSRNAGSSNAALARLCQKLGYNGFSEFRFSLNSYLLSQSGSHPDGIDDADDPFQNILNTYTRYIQMIPNYLPQEQLHHAAQQICRAQRLNIWGFNRTYQSAKQLSNRLGRLGIFSKCTDDWIVMTDDAEIMGEKDLCVVLSMEGRGFSGKENILSSLKEHGCPLLLITMNAKMPLAQFADQLLLLPRITDDSPSNFFEDQVIVYVALELLLYEIAQLQIDSSSAHEVSPT